MFTLPKTSYIRIAGAILILMVMSTLSAAASASSIDDASLLAPRQADKPYDPQWISAGGQHTCAILVGGDVECWGWDLFGQGGYHSGPFVQVSAGVYHTCALKTDGSAVCWGNNQFYGNASHPGPFIQIDTGAYHTCGLKTDYSVECWGDNWYGQLESPAGQFSQISAGMLHSCGLKSDGKVACWGDNSYLQAGESSGPYKQVSAGWTRTCGLGADGHLGCWGDNGKGIWHPGPFVQITTGLNGYDCGLKADGSADCWNIATQESYSSVGRFRQITTGNGHSCGLTRFGSIDCWGSNNKGQAEHQDGPYGQIIGRPVGVADRYHTGIDEALHVEPFGILANDTNALGDPRVYYLDANGHIHELFWFSNWWNHLDVTASNQSPAAAGKVLTSTTVNGDPRVYYLTADGHIHELAWTTGQWSRRWYHRDLMDKTDWPTAAPGQTLTSMSIGGEPRVYYLDANQHIHELAWVVDKWSHSDITDRAGATPALPGSRLSATTTANGDPAVYYFTSDHSIHELSYYNDTWFHWDLTSDSGGPPAVGYSSLTAISVQNDPRVYYQTGNGHVHELAWIGGEWVHTDLTDEVASENPAPATGMVVAIPITNGDPRLYYTSANGHIHELAWVSGEAPGWHYSDLTAITGGTTAAGGLGVTTAALDPRVYYLNGLQDIDELAWVGGETPDWYWSDVTIRSGGSAALANTVPSTTTANVSPLTAELTDDVDHGTLELNSDGSFSYTPNPGFEGQDIFRYQANDWWSLSDEVEVSLTVGPPMVVVDVDISIYNNPTGADRAPYENIIRHFADALYESSNGARKLGMVTFYIANTHADAAQILWDQQKCHPMATRSNAAWLQVHFCDIFENGVNNNDGTFSDYSYLMDDTHQKGGGYSLAHEWGHYYFGLYDEYATQPNDVAVENSIMNSQWKALYGNNNWLNFSIPANFNLANNQGRRHQASGWTTLMRPASEDPRTTAEQLGLPTRHAYRDLQRVGPTGNQTSPLELPGTARSELSINWVALSAVEAARMMAAGVPLYAEVTSLPGDTISYPDPLILVAVVQKNLPLTGVGVQGSVRLPDGANKAIAFKDDGIPPDAKKEDGLYTAVVTYTMNGVHTVEVRFDNHAGKAAFVSSAYEPAAGINGDYIPMPPPVPYTTDFTVSDTLEVVVANVTADDHGNTPGNARSIAANNEPAAGKIEKAGDVDVFRFATLNEGITYVRITNLALGMNPRLRVLAPDGKTLLFEARLDPSRSVYPFVPLVEVAPGTVVYVEVADDSTIGFGGLYELSAGTSLASDVAWPFQLYIPHSSR